MGEWITFKRFDYYYCLILSYKLKSKRSDIIRVITRMTVFFCIAICPFNQLNSQVVGDSSPPDTIQVKGGNYIIIEDEIMFIPRDTILILPANARFLIEKDAYTKSTNLYDSIQSKAFQRTWTRFLHELLFVESAQAVEGVRDKRKSEDQYLINKGQKIRNIKLIRTDIFGPTILDTTVTSTTWLGSTLNKLHVYTNEKIIRNNLLIEEGDEVDPHLLADNERILRKLKFLYDARIQVIPVSEEYVDVYVITKDLYSFGFGMAFDGVDPSVVEIYERNILGIGHEIHGRLNYDYKPDPVEDYDTVSPLGWEAIYKISNIGKSFIQSELHILNGDYHKYYGARLSRKFVTPRTKYAGGINITLESKLVNTDTIGWFKGNYQDYWLGRSFLIDPDNRSRIIIATRFIHNNVFEKPELQADAYHDLQDYELYLGSLAFSKQNYYETNMIYNYGRIEDIPYGSLIEFTGGYEKNEFGNRFYTSLYLSAGNYLNRFGYVQSSFAIGGFVSGGAYQQGMIQAKANYFTNAYPIRKSYFRQFVNLDYTIGIRPYQDEEININYDKGIRGLSGDDLYGTHRLAIKLESVAFTPLYLYGFRFAFYGFTDLALIGDYNRSIFNNPLNTGLGVGVRIRNENLVFKTFQIRFALYPNLPNHYSPNMFTISGEKLLDPHDFNFIAPQPLRFR